MFKPTVILSVVAFLAVTRGVATATTNSGCNESNLKCCVQTVNPVNLDQTLEELLSEFDILDLATQVGGDIGLDCTNILGTTCEQQAVCCSNTTYSGLINIGCSPITL